MIVWDGGNNDFPFYRARSADHRRRPAARRPRARATTPARPTCAWPTSSSSTRSTAPTPERRRARARRHRARSTRGATVDRGRVAGDARSRPAARRAGACSSSRTGRRSPTAAWRSAPARSRRAQAGAAELVDPRPCAVGIDRRHASRATRTSAPCCPAMGYGDEQLRELAGDDRRASSATSSSPGRRSTSGA